ncbi:MAG: glycosyltransferase family 9 protein [Chloroflexi bacterium]|nr:glycosyltransferase family 9 protein [Chloroflexota bacterium]
MDRDTLAARNIALSEAFRKPPLKHLLRRRLLSIVAHVRFAPMRPSRRVLLIRPDHVGDMLLTLPAIRALKAARPDLELHALVGPWAASVLENVVEVERVLTLPFPGFGRSEEHHTHSPYVQAVTASRMLRKIGYDSAVILRPDHWWGAMLAHLAGIRRRIGFDLPDVAPFLNERIPFQNAHAVVNCLQLVESWTGALQADAMGLNYPFSSLDDDDASSLLRRSGLPADARIVCIHPGSGTWTKQWTDERWAQVGDTLSEQLDATVVLTGREHELPMTRHIAELMSASAVVAAGETSVGTLAALFARSLVVLGPDSGPIHLASAVNTPTVALFGPARVHEFGTWGPSDRHAVLTSDIACLGCGVLDWGSDLPEYHPCVTDISAGSVLEAARRITSH